MNYPADLKYTDHDEWVRLDDDIITIGITDYAQDALGELVHIEFPEVGDEFEAGDSLCEVESVKAVAEVYAPADGEVTEINDGLDGEEGAVNTDPYGEGWLVRMKVSDIAQVEALLDAEAYEQKVADE